MTEVDDDNESIKAIRTAIEIEIVGLETFQKYAEQTKSEAGKKVFLQLAKDEKRHREILEDQLNKLTEGKPWEDVEIPASEIEQVVPKLRERAVETKGEAGAGEIDALNAALDLEKRASEFFREKAEQAEEPEAKALFLRLAEWEDSHYDLIKAELDSINHSGFWFDIREFRMDAMY
ncbi:MAG: ferritin family protein [Thermoplasmata archaeon]|nr:MAG: ferritin family protein [Thermoplasmata archaeon]